MIDLQKRLSILAAALSTDARQAARSARALGFNGILFDAITPSLNLTELSQTGRREFRHVLSSSNLELVGLRRDLDAKGLGPAADVDRVLNELNQVLETAAGMGAPLVCIDLAALPPAPPAPEAPKPQVTPDMAGMIILPMAPAAAQPPPPPRELSPADRALAARLDDVMGAMCASADRYSVTLALRSELSDFASLQSILRRSGCPWTGVELDPVAILRDSWPLDEIFSRLGPLIRHVRVRDAVLGQDRRTRPTPVGQGSAMSCEFLEALDAAGYQGWLTIDPMELSDRVAAAVQARKHLVSLA
jgi:sugar phosphate isomerase/epimerase